MGHIAPTQATLDDGHHEKAEEEASWYAGKGLHARFGVRDAGTSGEGLRSDGNRAGATGCYIRWMRTISQRELRNDNAAIVRSVEDGESFTVTRRGVPVARLIPISDGDLTCERPATTRPRYSQMRRVTISESTRELLDDLRGER